MDLKNELSPSNYAFLSYSRVENELSEPLIKEFYELLMNEVHKLQRESVIRCSSEFHSEVSDLTSYQFTGEEQTARVLCESACMILVFTPNYFSEKNTRCAKEYKAMENLEESRLKDFEIQYSDHGLIIPVVFRGWSYLPDELKKRHPYNFEDCLISNNSFKDQQFAISQIKQIAKYILNFYEKLSIEDCKKFSLIDEDDQLKKWLKGISTTKKFFGRDASSTRKPEGLALGGT